MHFWNKKHAQVSALKTQNILGFEKPLKLTNGQEAVALNRVNRQYRKK